KYSILKSIYKKNKILNLPKKLRNGPKPPKPAIDIDLEDYKGQNLEIFTEIKSQIAVKKSIESPTKLSNLKKKNLIDCIVKKILNSENSKQELEWPNLIQKVEKARKIPSIKVIRIPKELDTNLSILELKNSELEKMKMQSQIQGQINGQKLLNELVRNKDNIEYMAKLNSLREEDEKINCGHRLKAKEILNDYIEFENKQQEEFESNLSVTSAKIGLTLKFLAEELKREKETSKILQLAQKAHLERVQREKIEKQKRAQEMESLQFKEAIIVRQIKNIAHSLSRTTLTNFLNRTIAKTSSSEAMKKASDYALALEKNDQMPSSENLESNLDFIADLTSNSIVRTVEIQNKLKYEQELELYMKEKVREAIKSELKKMS
ncbi:MAG: hypothetical protein MHPSP_000892, partial [Paramarteilia canceri]